MKQSPTIEAVSGPIIRDIHNPDYGKPEPSMLGIVPLIFPPVAIELSEVEARLAKLEVAQRASVA